MSRRRNVHLQLWLTAEENCRLKELAQQWSQDERGIRAVQPRQARQIDGGIP
jgi:hypothetical protein